MYSSTSHHSASGPSGRLLRPRARHNAGPRAGARPGPAPDRPRWSRSACSSCSTAPACSTRAARSTAGGRCCWSPRASSRSPSVRRRSSGARSSRASGAILLLFSTDSGGQRLGLPLARGGDPRRAGDRRPLERPRSRGRRHRRGRGPLDGGLRRPEARQHGAALRGRVAHGDLRRHHARPSRCTATRPRERRSTPRRPSGGSTSSCRRAGGISVRSTPIFGGLDDKTDRSEPPGADAPTLHVDAVSIFGGVRSSTRASGAGRTSSRSRERSG